MRITINGASNQDYDTELSVSDLVASLGLAGQPVLVEIEGRALFPREFEETIVTEGAEVEIIRIAAGG
jgi:sulfur carrier protein